MEILVTDFAISELLYGDDLLLMGETIKGLRNMFSRWKEAFASVGKLNLEKPRSLLF